MAYLRVVVINDKLEGVLINEVDLWPELPKPYTYYRQSIRINERSVIP